MFFGPRGAATSGVLLSIAPKASRPKAGAGETPYARTTIYQHRAGLGRTLPCRPIGPWAGDAALRHRRTGSRDRAESLRRCFGPRNSAASTIVANRRSAAVRGTYAPDEALRLLLSRTGLGGEVVDGAFVIHPIGDAGADASPDATADIVVTGSRIRGAPVAAPVISARSHVRSSTGRWPTGRSTIRHRPAHRR